MKKFYLSLVALLATTHMFAQGWPAKYDGVMLQGFYWDSYRDSKWTNLESQADELSQYFKLVWIPQSAYCGGKSMGYNDLYWFSNYNSSFGTESELRSLIKTFTPWHWYHRRCGHQPPQHLDLLLRLSRRDIQRSNLQDVLDRRLRQRRQGRDKEMG